MRYPPLLAALLLLLGAAPLPAQDEARLLRFPATDGKRIVFTYAGNLYTVAAHGGMARRLTSHDGFEMFARFSPDGKWLAFTGQYDGNTEVYLMPAEGGVPRRLTFTATLARDDVSDRMGPNNLVMGWTPDGRHVIFRSRMHEWNDFLGQLYLVPVEGGLPRQLPLPRGGFCSFSPDGTRLAYNRVFREFRTWKRYRGGMADEIWIHDLQTKKTEALTNHPASDIIPMWHGDKVYFLSDRDRHRRMNLYAADVTTKAVRQLTHFTDWDCKFPSLGRGAIVFENAGYVWRLDLVTEKAHKVPIRIGEDQAAGRSVLHAVGGEVLSYEIAPDGKRALFSARGDLFTVPAKQGPTRNLTRSPGVHDRNPKWSPDGKTIAYVSDKTGEDEIWTVPADGKGAPRPVTQTGDTYKYTLFWSPDGQKVLWADKKLRLQYVETATGTVHTVAQAVAWEIHDYCWSPDSKWIAYSLPEVETEPRIWLYSLAQRKAFPVTDGWYDSYWPAFSSDGKFLFFVSARDFEPVISRTEWNHAYLDQSRIYLVTLAKAIPSPLRPQSDEAGSAGPPGEDKKGPREKKGPLALQVDPDGIAGRIVQLPVPVANYRSLTSVGDALYYLRSSSRDRATLNLFDLGHKKEVGLGPVAGFEISWDGKKMLVSKDKKFAIIDLPKGPVNLGELLDLSAMQVTLDRHAEWEQIFRECWRQMRDFFYDPDLHGVDWPALRQRYEPLLAHVNHRADLTAVIGDMIAELNCSHTYVGGGDMPRPARIKTGLLGAGLDRDAASGAFRITKILPGENWRPALRSPLTEPGVEVREGDWIVAINGRPSKTLANPYEALLDTVGKQVVLRVNSKPAEDGARDVTVLPTGEEGPLYYHAWVRDNIRKVSEATAGKVGYLHIPDMQFAGLNEFVKHFYPQLRKKALIIDVRGNGGGNVSPQIIERLRRELVMIGAARNAAPRPDPVAGLYGPMVCLVNEFSASDGDLFPYRFRKSGLGKLVGKRTWGGVVGIRGTLPLLDGGYLNKPEFAPYDPDGKQWIIEGHGVDPDVVVDNDPAREYAGIDDQLNRAIEIVQQELAARERRIPARPPIPKR